MKTILAVDSTTEVLGISLSENSKIISEIKDDKSCRHMVNIIGNLDTVLKNSNKSIKDVDLFAVNLGPGNFTGGRISMSIVKIFSMLSQKPAIGFNALDVFSVQCMLKNIESIAQKKSESLKVFIMPLMDVRNNEFFFSIYEIRSNKEDTGQIYEFDFRSNRYHLLKRYENCVLKSEEFSKKFPEIIRKLFILDYLRCFKCNDQIYEKNDFYKDCKSFEKDKTTANGSKKESILMITGNGIRSYRILLEKLKQDIEDSYDFIKIRIDEKNINPKSKYLNYMAHYSLDKGLESLPISPVYIRDFIAFGEK